MNTAFFIADVLVTKDGGFFFMLLEGKMIQMYLKTYRLLFSLSMFRKQKRDSSIGRAIKKVKRSVNVCESFPQEKAVCFGNEDGEHGLATCDSKSLYFNVEACCARTIGLSSCLGSDTMDKCGLSSSFIVLEGVGCANDITEGLNGTVVSHGGVPDQPREAPKLVHESLSDENLASYLLESNRTMWEVKASVNATIVKFLEKEKDLFVDGNHTNGGGHRQLPWAGAVAATVAIIEVTNKAIQAFIVDPINDEYRQREAFTKESAEQCVSNNPDYSCIVISSWIPHDVSGSNYVRVSHTFTGWFGRTYTYYVYAAQNSKSFRLTNYGDGGYVNWAYDGYFNQNGKTLDMQVWFTGARVYEHHWGQGWVMYLSATSVSYYNRGIAFLNDAISSVEVDPGCRAIGYEHSYLQGYAVSMGVGFYNLHDYQWGDRISSMTVRC